jgi:signal transduction histidine kinase
MSDPVDAPARLDAPQGLVLDADARSALERVVRLASAVLEAPIAAVIAMRDGEARAVASVGALRFEDAASWFAAAPGLVLDATRDETLCAHPWVRESGVRFSCAVPLLAAGGVETVLLCVLDPRARTEVSAAKSAGLADLAALASEMLDRPRVPDRDSPLASLCAGLAHELNNPLAFVLSNLGFVREELRALGRELDPRHGPAISSLDQAIDEATDGADRMRAIVHELSTFANQYEGGGRVELELLATAAIRRVASALPPTVRVETRFEPAPAVSVAPAQLIQAIVNVLLNAAQSLEGEPAQQRIEVATGTDASGRAVLAISDSGHGIAPEHLPRIFDPFFTTRRAGGGVGLGLSVCKNLIAALGGTVEIESELGRGTRVRIVLPPAQ